MVTVNITLTPKQIGLLLGIMWHIDRDLVYTTSEEYEIHKQVESILEAAENEITNLY